MGAADGFVDGNEEGDADGCERDGDFEGCERDGDLDGDRDGDLDGALEGSGVVGTMSAGGMQRHK